MKANTTLFIVLAMALGIITGWGVHNFFAPDQANAIAAQLNLITDLFLRLIKMIIAPLVFSTLVTGIAHMEDIASVGRIGAKAMLWFLSASLASLLVGLIMVQLLKPGIGLDLIPINPEGNLPVASTNAFSISAFITHLVPISIFDALARNEILQIVVFSLFVGSAVSALDNKTPAVLHLVEQVAAIMLKVTEFIMRLAPLSIFAALASAIATQGAGLLATYAKFVLGFYLAMFVLWLLLFLAAFTVLGRNATRLFSEIRAPVLLAFSTASSEAAYSRLLEILPNAGIRRRIVNFVLPLGYSFNLDGSMIYCTFGALFIMQAHGIELSLHQQIFMVALLMITSKGMAGIPRTSLVVIMATLTYFGLPETWIALVLGVDHLLDMGRSATNVIGNSVAAAVVDKWERKDHAQDGQTAL
ncbi:dicarboxylate/amino acid:cation symporter [Ochrobactrum sp. GPK 3]|uniref:dicarboxylate/amino acid:cation symporter n=1 Tax=Brucella sp. 22210 TaxID=3453892 RepID=UPI0031385AA6